MIMAIIILNTNLTNATFLRFVFVCMYRCHVKMPVLLMHHAIGAHTSGREGGKGGEGLGAYLFAMHTCLLTLSVHAQEGCM